MLLRTNSVQTFALQRKETDSSITNTKYLNVIKDHDKQVW